MLLINWLFAIWLLVGIMTSISTSDKPKAALGPGGAALRTIVWGAFLVWFIVANWGGWTVTF